MKRRISNIIYKLLVVFIITVPNLSAQQSIELGGWLGASYYFGDLNSSFRLSDPNPAGGLIFRYNFDSRINLKSSLNFAQLSADDANSDNAFEQARNLSFSSFVWDFTNQLDFNFMPYIHGDREKWFTPYLLIGLSLYHVNPKAELNGESFALRDLGTEGQLLGEEYNLINLAIAYGFGYKFDINPKWSINIELSNRLLFTDYTDDVSGVYTDLDELEGLRGPIARQLSDRSISELNTFGLGEPGKQRGNSRKNDSIHYLGISLMYHITWLECPKITPF